MPRGAAVDLARRVRLTSVEDLARDPELGRLEATIGRLHIACASELSALERESGRNPSTVWSDVAIFGGAAATAVGLIDAIVSATATFPWLSVVLGIGGMASSALGIGDKHREREANANRAFEIRTLRRDLDQLNEARQRLKEARAAAGEACR